MKVEFFCNFANYIKRNSITRQNHRNKDWATILFIICLAIIAINKTISSVRFNEFVRLAYSLINTLKFIAIVVTMMVLPDVCGAVNFIFVLRYWF